MGQRPGGGVTHRDQSLELLACNLPSGAHSLLQYQLAVGIHFKNVFAGFHAYIHKHMHGLRKALHVLHTW